MDVWRFVVEGDGPFPFQMLFVESCWPATMVDVSCMTGTGLRRVILESADLPAKVSWSQSSWRMLGNPNRIAAA